MCIRDSNAVKPFTATWEGDVPILRRYCVDELDKVPEYEMRKWYWDMEWMPKGSEHEDAITTIAVYDNYNDETYQSVWFPDTTYHESQRKYTFGSEKEMLLHFVTMMNQHDPDMLIAWWGLKSDIPQLIKRLFANKIDPRKLSPHKEVKNVGFNALGSVEYSNIEQPIRGRLCLNLDLAFERQWMDAQRGTLPSLSLDYVSESVLGEKKLVSDKFPDKNEFFRRGWQEDTETYLEYALKDVELIKRIDDENFTTEAILSLQRLLIAPFDACFYASNMGGIYFMRNASWKAPTGMKGDRVDYDGAMVYDPLSEATNGLHLGVAAFDFAGLYPSMMIARNISWETKSDTPTEFGVNIKTPKDFSRRSDRF